jgi:hypothetical protein
MTFAVELRLSVLIEQDSIDIEAAKAVAKDKVANGPCLFVAEGWVTGAHKLAGHYLVKGMSAEVLEARPYLGNRRVNLAKTEEPEEGA